MESEMAAAKGDHVHPDFAIKVMGRIPAELRKSVEIKKGSGEYSIIRVRGRSIASVRDGSVKVNHRHSGTVDDATRIAKLIAAASPNEAPKPKATPKSKAAKPKATKEPSAEAERAAEAEIEAAREAEAAT